MRSIGRALFLLILTLFSAFFAGCSGDDGESAGARRERLSEISGLCEEWAHLACNDRVRERCAAASAEDCESSQQQHCEQILEDRDFNPRFADSCLRAVRSALSDAELDGEEYAVITEAGGDCEFLSSIGMPLGGTCGSDKDCDPTAELICALPRDGSRGSCAKPVLVKGGFSCEEPASRCAEGFYCDGEDCLALGIIDDDCSDAEPCAAEFKCRQGKCEARAELGGTCRSGDDCISRICARTGDGDEMLCVDKVVLSVSEPLCAALR
jgi:hypothetical protein